MKKNKFNMIFLFSMFVILACAFSLLRVFTLDGVPDVSSGDKVAGSSGEMNDSWYYIDDDGSIILFDNFNEKISSGEVTLSRIFISDETENDTLLFENNYCAVEVYQDGRLIYGYGSREDLEKGTLLGNCYCIVPLEIEYGQASEVMVVFMSDDYVRISGFEFGPEETMISKRFTDFIPTLICNVGALISIILLIVMIYYGNANHIVDASYFHFLAFLALISTWSLADSQILEGLGVPAGKVCIVMFETYMLCMIPFFLFMYSSFDCMNTWDLIMASAYALNFVVLNVLQFTGIRTFNNTHSVTNILIFTGMMFVFVQIICEYRLNSSHITGSLLIGFIILILSSSCQMFLSYVGIDNNNAIILQVGMVIFIVIQILNIVKTLFNKVDAGFQAETYLELAKTDSLTGLGNRRGLDFLIDNMSQTHRGTVRIGCVVCDLNDLKKTNDSFGHDEGDNLIVDFARCLTQCYNDVGVPFRTGGDEFYIMFCNIEVDMKAMLRRLESELEKCNATRSIRISCSSGASADYVDSSDPKAIWNVIKKADEEMYIIKKIDRAKRLIER